MRQAGICGWSIQRIQRIQKNVIEKIEKIETKGWLAQEPINGERMENSPMVGWHFGKFLKGGLIAPAFFAAPKLDPLPPSTCNNMRNAESCSTEITSIHRCSTGLCGRSVDDHAA